jgi:hypothetical protein
MKPFAKKKTKRQAVEFSTNSILGNNKGIALVMVLILSLISLAIMSGLIYMVTSGTQVSGIEKRYRSACEAGKSGKEIAYQVIAARGNPFTAAEATALNFIAGACLNQKIDDATYVNSTYNWGSCSSSLTITPATADMSFQLGSNPAYAVYVKIVDTVLGNSGPLESALYKTGVVINDAKKILPVPYLYSIEITTENIDNPTEERCNLSVLYQY